MVNRSEASLERARAVSRAAKRRRRGVCVSCGGPTRYSGHGSGVSERCPPCAAVDRGLRSRGTGERQRRVLELLAERGEMRYMEIAAATDTRVEAMGQLMTRLLRSGLVERAGRGVYRLAERSSP